MGLGNSVTEEQCSSRLNEVFSKIENVSRRVNTIDKSLAKVYGGIAVLAFVSTLFFSLVSFHINEKFSGIEGQIKTVDDRLIEVIKKGG